MARKDDLDKLIDELAVEDAAVRLRIAAALERRELARQLAERRRDAGLTQAELANRMGTSQGQVTRFESGADARLSTVARYAAAIGVELRWSIQPRDLPRKPTAAVSRRRSTRGNRSSTQHARRSA
jgi:ribosome-binding protein aMBF1 (putative translation factor)